VALERYRPKSARDEIFDKQARGLGVRVTAASKSLFFIRRVKGQKVRFTLGQYPVLSLASARKQAFDIIEKIKDGGDQCDEYGIRRKRAETEEPDTFSHVADRFIREYAEGKKKPLRKATIKGYRRALQGDLTAKWNAKPLAVPASCPVRRGNPPPNRQGRCRSGRR